MYGVFSFKSERMAFLHLNLNVWRFFNLNRNGWRFYISECMAFFHSYRNVWRFYIWFRTTSVFTFKSGIAVFFTFKSGNRAFLIKIQTNGVSTLVSPETLSRHWPGPSGRGRGVSNFQSFSRKCFSVKKQSERKKNYRNKLTHCS